MPKHTAITGGGLLLQETRVVARLLLEGIPQEKLVATVAEGNLLQKRSPGATKSMATLVARRLNGLAETHLRVLSDGGGEEATLLLLCIMAEIHPIVGDFLAYIGRECVAQRRMKLNRKADWERYLEQCAIVTPTVSQWKECTRDKLRSLVLGMLSAAGVLDAKGVEVRYVRLPASVAAYLSEPGHEYARACMGGLTA